MRVQLKKTFVAAAVATALTFALGQAQAQQAQKNWKDRAEYDLVQAIGKEADGAKKLALLDQWKEKYPATDFKIERLVSYLDAYRTLNKPQDMWSQAKLILAEDPKNITALYWASLLVVSMGNSGPENLDFGEKAARALADNIDELKPAGVSDADWANTKTALKLGAVGHRALGWIAWQRKNFEEAEKQLSENLKQNGADAEASYWLGQTILGQGKIERQSDALFHFARAAAYDGPGALDAGRRRQMEAYITKTYTSYHGADPDGLKDLLATAKANVFPPPDFKVLSSDEVKEQKIHQIADPALKFWVKLKDALKADAAYFEGGMKGALIPPETGEQATPPLNATVISATPARAPKEVVVAISDATTPEAVIKLETPLPGPAEPGTKIKFRGVATEFRAEPFQVTFEAERKQIEGWPTPAPAAKKAAGKKKK